MGRKANKPKLGETFGKLTVVDLDGPPIKDRPTIVYKCICGSLYTCRHTYVLKNLQIGTTVSCGCYRKELVKTVNKTHGMSRSPEYTTWCHIRGRCHNEKNSHYKYYGGRGIKMSEEWFNSFEIFLNDIGPRPGQGYSIERVDVNKNYCKENCIWIKTEEQIYNKQNTRKVLVDNIVYIASKLARELGVCVDTLIKRDKLWNTSK